MSFARARDEHDHAHPDAGAPAPGKRALTDRVQRRTAAEPVATGAPPPRWVDDSLQPGTSYLDTVLVQRKGAPTAGPSAEDRWDGPAQPPPAAIAAPRHDLRGRVVGRSQEGDAIELMIGLGAAHGVTMGMPGFLHDGSGRPALDLEICRVANDVSYALVHTSHDDVIAHRQVVLAPSRPGGAPVQRKADGHTGLDDTAVHDLAARGTSGAGGPLPHLDRIQAAFGDHDVRGVVAHTGGAAAEAAAGMGAQAYATGHQIAFASAPDLHTAAHEAAHVVQQRAGVQLLGGVGQVGDAYEQHADQVADAVVRGEDAAPLLDLHAGGGAPVQRAVQRFDSPTHKAVADAGGGATPFKLDGGIELTRGDFTMLTGDYFEPEVLDTFAARKSPLIGQTLETQDEVVYAIYDAMTSKTKGLLDPRFGPGGPWHHYTMVFSPAVKKAVKDRYYRLAGKNYDHFVEPGTPEQGDPGFNGQGVGWTAHLRYRTEHHLAIMMAFKAKTAAELDRAMIREAIAQHFLTDAFAAGHVTTHRLGLEQSWDRRKPFSNFAPFFKMKLVHEMARHIKAHARGVATMASEADYRAGVQAQLDELFAGKPEPTFGKLMASIAHDFDNTEGMWFTNDLGWKWYGRGDSHIDDKPPASSQNGRPQREVVVAAVKAGYDDLKNAHAVGVTSDHKLPDRGPNVFDLVRLRTPPPAYPLANKFGAEQMLPRFLDPQQADQQTYSSSLEDLWDMPIRPGQPTWGKLISADMLPDGTVGGDLQSAHDDMTEPVNPLDAMKGGLSKSIARVMELALREDKDGRVTNNQALIYPKTAFRERVLEPIRKDTRAFIRAVLGGG